MPIYFTINHPHQWVITDNKAVVDSGVADGLSELPVAGHHCVAVVPGEQVVTREVVMPVRNRAKLMAAIPYAIEDSVVSPVDDLHFILLHTGDENRVSFAYVSRELMTSWVQKIQDAGFSVDAMLPDYFLLPGASSDSAVMTLAGENRVLVRSGLYQGAVTDQENLPAWLSGLDADSSLLVDDQLSPLLPDDIEQRITKTEIGAGLADWLLQERPEHDTGLLKAAYSQGSKRNIFKQYWPAVAMIALAGFIKLGSDVVELVWLQQSNAKTEQSMQSLYQEMFPGSKLLPGRARVQTKNKINGLLNRSAGNDFTYLLVTTTELLQGQMVVVEELDYRKGGLTTVLTLNDFAHLDRVQQELRSKSSLDVVLKQSGARGSKVQARFEISRAAI